MEKTIFKHSLGTTAKDKETGLEGLLDQLSIRHNGNKQYSLIPQSKDGKKRHDSFFIDEGNIEQENPAETVMEWEHPLGAKVECKITGFKGTLTQVVLYQNGCRYYMVTGKYNDRLGKPNKLWAFESDLQLISKPVNPTKKNGPGGPSERSYKY